MVKIVIQQNYKKTIEEIFFLKNKHTLNPVVYSISNSIF